MGGNGGGESQLTIGLNVFRNNVRIVGPGSRSVSVSPELTRDCVAYSVNLPPMSRQFFN